MSRGYTGKALITSFHSQEIVFEIVKSKEQLKKIGIRVRQDFPREIMENRRCLFPVLDEAKKFDEAAHIKADKLIFKGKSYAFNKLPEEIDQTRISAKITDKVLLFHGRMSPFSNFYISDFDVDGITYVCNEQYYQSNKARIYLEESMTKQIMSTQDPFEMKRLGDRIKVDDKWRDDIRIDTMKVGLRAKFEQNEKLKDMLQNTDKLTLVEASKDDTFWGIGLTVNDPNAINSLKWQGQNMLGACLNEIRSDLMRV
jgi:ribA/ribD-fused uncharacterized protein